MYSRFGIEEHGLELCVPEFGKPLLAFSLETVPLSCCFHKDDWKAEWFSQLTGNIFFAGGKFAFQTNRRVKMADPAAAAG